MVDLSESLPLLGQRPSIEKPKLPEYVGDTSKALHY